jgi:hypothetical protein
MHICTSSPSFFTFPLPYWFETLEFVPLKISNINFGGPVYTKQKTLALNESCKWIVESVPQISKSLNGIANFFKNNNISE